jgi:hypothetical protein
VPEKVDLSWREAERGDGRGARAGHRTSPCPRTTPCRLLSRGTGRPRLMGRIRVPPLSRRRTDSLTRRSRSALHRACRCGRGHGRLPRPRTGPHTVRYLRAHRSREGHAVTEDVCGADYRGSVRRPQCPKEFLDIGERRGDRRPADRTPLRVGQHLRPARRAEVSNHAGPQLVAAVPARDAERRESPALAEIRNGMAAICNPHDTITSPPIDRS